MDAVTSTAFDVVVSDIRMTGLTGIDLLEAIRRHDPDVPVILLTGAPSLDTAMEAVELGALQYLLEPVDVSELRASVERASILQRLATTSAGEERP